MNLQYRLPMALLFTLLTSCSGLIVPYQNAIPVGTTITLNREIRIPDHQFSVLMQNGEIRSKVSKYYPHCEIVVKASGKNYRLIHPDRFKVIKVNYEEMVSAPTTKYVGIRGHFDGGTFEPYTTLLYLHSPRQPHVYQLECSHWELITEAEHLTRAQIQEALGKIFTIEN